MVVTLYPKKTFRIPVEAECISPDFFAGKLDKEIAALQVWEGNRKRSLGNLFKIENTSSEENTIRISGDVGKVRRIGTKMSMGNIIVEGDAGMHLGEEMEGGEITVTGNADSWTGSIMKDGIIEVKGDAGDYIGSAYRGSIQGMNGGKIIIHGNAGSEVGCFMRNGLIKVYGNVGIYAGMHMRNGTIFVKGDSKGRAGAQMTNGKIVLCGYTPSVLPTFTFDDIRPKVKVDKEPVQGPFYRFIGDLADNGNGKLFVAKKSNQHLSSYEEYLKQDFDLSPV